MISIVPGNNNSYRKNNGAKVASAIILLFGLLFFFLAFIGFNKFDISYGMQPWTILSISSFILVVVFIGLITIIATSMSKKYKDNNNEALLKRKNLMDLYSNNNKIQKVNPYVKKLEYGYRIPFSDGKNKMDLPIGSKGHYCMYCGSKVDNTAIYCHQCGIKLE